MFVPTSLTDEQRSYLHRLRRGQRDCRSSPRRSSTRGTPSRIWKTARSTSSCVSTKKPTTPKTRQKASTKEGKQAQEEQGRSRRKDPRRAPPLAQNVGAEGTMLGLIPLPRQCARVVEAARRRAVTSSCLSMRWKWSLTEVFSMYTVKHTNVICVTRNADIDANGVTDENDEDYREHMKRILKKRARLSPGAPRKRARSSRDTVEPLAARSPELDRSIRCSSTSVPLDMSYTWGLASHLVRPKQRAALTQYAVHACNGRHASTASAPSWSRSRRAATCCLSYPYESMDPFVQLLREASARPCASSQSRSRSTALRASRISPRRSSTPPRTARRSPRCSSCARASTRANNIEWSQRFEQAGCTRHLRLPRLQGALARSAASRARPTTACSTSRSWARAITTRRLPSSTPTCRSSPTSPSIGRDATEFFRNMALENVSDNYDVLWVAPLQVKPLHPEEHRPPDRTCAPRRAVWAVLQDELGHRQGDHRQDRRGVAGGREDRHARSRDIMPGPRRGRLHRERARRVHCGAHARA